MITEKPRRIWEISPLISEKIAVFPGDTPFSREVALSFEQGHHLTLSALRSTLHLGAHADAANHYDAKGGGVEARALDPYLGPVQVCAVDLPRGERILPHHLKAPIEARRVLFATNSFPDPNQWNDDFNSLSPELIHHLADLGVMLVGIDTPSVDPATSKKLESHQALMARDVCVLEGIVLSEVPEGLYNLVALPLRIQHADASPVRAILLERDV
ncbi:MAG: kynurenine formamidase [Proteobacteria bacterium]|nr:MAG: kynurenine formamidase [Pseudomonadota bacterium]